MRGDTGMAPAPPCSLILAACTPAGVSAVESDALGWACALGQAARCRVTPHRGAGLPAARLGRVGRLPAHGAPSKDCQAGHGPVVVARGGLPYLELARGRHLAVPAGLPAARHAGGLCAVRRVLQDHTPVRAGGRPSPAAGRCAACLPAVWTHALAGGRGCGCLTCWYGRAGGLAPPPGSLASVDRRATAPLKGLEPGAATGCCAWGTGVGAAVKPPGTCSASRASGQGHPLKVWQEGQAVATLRGPGGERQQPAARAPWQRPGARALATGVGRTLQAQRGLGELPRPPADARRVWDKQGAVRQHAAAGTPLGRRPAQAADGGAGRPSSALAREAPGACAARCAGYSAPGGAGTPGRAPRRRTPPSACGRRPTAGRAHAPRPPAGPPAPCPSAPSPCSSVPWPLRSTCL